MNSEQMKRNRGICNRHGHKFTNNKVCKHCGWDDVSKTCIYDEKGGDNNGTNTSIV
jgi:hypothetical protein